MAGGNKRQQRKRSQFSTFLIVLGALVLPVAGILVLTAADSSSAEVDDARLLLDPTIGPEDAPVTIVEYGDLGCPSCRAFHNAGIRARLIDTYGDQIRFVFKDFPVITPQSPQAAEAGQCALDQGLFWEYHDVVYEEFQGLSKPDLLAYAARSGQDVDAFEACLDSGRHAATVRGDWREGEQLGLRGTPSFFVNGEPLIGPPYYDTFTAQIDAQLALR